MELFQVFAGHISHASPHIVSPGDDRRNEIKPIFERCQFTGNFERNQKPDELRFHV